MPHPEKFFFSWTSEDEFDERFYPKEFDFTPWVASQKCTDKSKTIPTEKQPISASSCYEDADELINPTISTNAQLSSSPRSEICLSDTLPVPSSSVDCDVNLSAGYSIPYSDVAEPSGYIETNPNNYDPSS